MIDDASKLLEACERDIKRSKRSLGVTLTIILLGIGYLAYLCCRGTFFSDFSLGLQKCSMVWQGIKVYLSTHGLQLFAALCFLPTFGFPITPFFILAGGIWGVYWGLVWSFFGLMINLSFSYFVYRYVLNRFLRRLLFKRFENFNLNGLKLNGWMVALIVQVIPTIPYCAQNYILSWFRSVQFLQFFVISLWVQFFWAYAFVLGGDAWSQGNAGLWAIGLIALLTILTYSFYKRLKK